MKVVAISTEDEAAGRYEEAVAQGYITFIYDHADPLREIAADKFVYVSSDEELKEKIRLVVADPLVVEQVMRF